MNRTPGGPISPHRSPSGGRDEGSNPYRSGEPVRFTGFRSRSRWIYLALVVLSCLGFFVTIGLWAAAAVMARHHRPEAAFMNAGAIVLVVTIFILYVHAFVGLYWLYAAWEWLPSDQRYSNHWRSRISPAQAALLLLVPYFHYYWMFVVNCGLCDAIDRMRVTHPTREAAPKGLAIASCLCQIFLPLPAGAIMWFVFMTKIERLTCEMSGTRRTLGADSGPSR